MPSNRTLANCLFVFILTLLVMAGAYNLRLQQGLTEEELRLTLSVQHALDRLVGPGHANTWLQVENGRLEALITVDKPDPEKFRGALESLLSVDATRGDRLTLVSGPHHGPSFIHEWRKARLLGFISLLLAVFYLAGLRRWEPSPAPAAVAWAARMTGGVLCLGLPLWLMLLKPSQLVFAGVVLTLLGRPWRLPRMPVPTVLKLATVALLGGLVYIHVAGPEARLSRQVRHSLGAPAWVISARRGEQWGSLAAVKVNPAESAPALRLAQLEAAARQSLPHVRLSLLGLEEVPVRGPWRLIALNVLAIAGLLYALSRPRPTPPVPAVAETPVQPTLAPRKTEPESIARLFQVDPLTVEVGRGLLHLVDPAKGARLLERVTAIRRHIALELGVVVPGVRFRDNLGLKNNEYRILLRTVEVARAELDPGRLLSIGPAEKLAAFGTVFPDATYGMPAVWLDPERRREAEGVGAMLFDEVSVVAVQLTEQIRKNAARLVTLQDAKALLDTLRKGHPMVVEIAEQRVGLMLIWEVLQGLLAESVSIRDLELILTACIRSGHYTPEELLEACRDELGAQICQSLQNPRGELVTAELPEEVERMLRRSPDGVLEPDDATRALELLQEAITRFEGQQPIFLTQPGLRLSLRRLTERTMPQVVCLSYTQVAPGVNVVHV